MMMIIRRYMMSGSALAKIRRFYKNANVVAIDDNKCEYNIYLDNSKLKTPNGRIVEIESKALALLIANEWNCQTNFINFQQMHSTSLLFTAIDNPYQLTSEDIVEKLMEYLETDTILYRSDKNDKLYELENEYWNPVIHSINETFNIHLKPVQNIVEVPSIDNKTKGIIKEYLLSYKFITLIAIQYAVQYLKSLLITIFIIHFNMNVHNAVHYALLEQIYQSQFWGNVEWYHDMERNELISRLSAALLFIYFTSQPTIFK